MILPIILAQKVESDIIAPFKFVPYDENTRYFQTEDGIFTLKLSADYMELFLYDRIIINRSNKGDALEDIPFRYFRKKLLRDLYQSFTYTDNEKISALYSSIHDRMTHGTYSISYLVKILNEGICKKDPFKLTPSCDMADANEYNIYTDLREGGTVAFEIMYHAETICVIESYGQLLEANAHVKRGLIEYCDRKIDAYERRLDEMSSLKSTLL